MAASDMSPKEAFQPYQRLLGERFGPERIVWTTVGWIVMKFGTDIKVGY